MAEHQHAHHHDSHSHSHDQKAAGEHAVKDPVCGMSVDPHSAEHRSEHGGKTWYFCSSRCQSKFDEDPEHYLSGEQKAGGARGSGHHVSPARCTRKFASRAPEIVPFAVWPSSRSK